MQKNSFKYKFGEIDKDLDFQSLIDNGAVLLDVRSYEEYELTQVDGSIHIPLDELEVYLEEERFPNMENQVILVYCQSGIRSQFAKEILLNYGFQQVYNAGSWMNFEEEKE